MSIGKIILLVAVGLFFSIGIAPVNADEVQPPFGHAFI
jgi:hypothetical protein